MKWKSYIAPSGERWLKSKMFKRFFITELNKNDKEDLVRILQVPDEMFEYTDFTITIVAHKRKLDK